MNSRQEIKKGLALYGCCVLLFACVVMLGSQLSVMTRIADLLIFPAAAIVYRLSDTPTVMRWFEIFPHFGSRGLPLVYAILFFTPLIGRAFSTKRTWLWLQGIFATVHLAACMWLG